MIYVYSNLVIVVHSFMNFKNKFSDLFDFNVLILMLKSPFQGSSIKCMYVCIK